MSLVKGYRRWTELVVDAALIMVGSAGPDRQDIGLFGLPETITTFEVEILVLARDGEPHPTVDVQQTGPIPPNMWVEDTWPLPVTGERYLLFLKPALRTGIYYSVGAYQGVFHVTQDDRVLPVMPDMQRIDDMTMGTRLDTVLVDIRATS